MPLLKGFSEIDQEGKLSIPSNILREAGLNLGSQVGIKVVRIKDSSRWPYLIVYPVRKSSISNGVYHPQNDPRLSQLEVTMMECQGGIDENGRLTLNNDLLEETKLQPNYRVEIKVVGPNHGCWLVIHNRGPARLTTLQEKMGRLGKSGRSAKKWQTQKWEY
ncbi:MAG: hypothetical protein QMC83_01805 [Thermodesulfovibrionales bacterium]|nr:hypothetical protein [Thermodesulfovibrionales bacterium]